MHRYGQIEYKAGATIEVIKHIPKWFRKKEIREPAQRKTKEEMQKANMEQATKRLARKINANFRPGDWHVVLTYRRDERPDPEQARKILREFLRQMRKVYQTAGYVFKYIHATEYKNKAIHHHLIVNNINDGKKTTTDYVRMYWKGKGNPKFTGLYDDGEYKKLADYIIKETEKTFRERPEKQRYACSRNLIIPKPERRIRTVKRLWQQDPKPRPGYYIDQDSLFNGFDFMGYPYQRYVMVKLHPSETDWPSNEWIKGPRKRRKTCRKSRSQ